MRDYMTAQLVRCRAGRPVPWERGGRNGSVPHIDILTCTLSRYHQRTNVGLRFMVRVHRIRGTGDRRSAIELRVAAGTAPIRSEFCMPAGCPSLRGDAHPAPEPGRPSGDSARRDPPLESAGWQPYLGNVIRNNKAYRNRTLQLTPAGSAV